jgi:hypothetical protein
VPARANHRGPSRTRTQEEIEEDFETARRDLQVLEAYFGENVA